MMWMWAGILIGAGSLPGGTAVLFGDNGRVRMSGRGALAWENFQDGLASMRPEVTRLLTHAAADATVGSTYIPNVR